MVSIKYPKRFGQGERPGRWRNISLLCSRKLGTKGIYLDGPVSRARTKSYVLRRGGTIQLGGWSVAQGPGETRASLFPGSAHRGARKAHGPSRIESAPRGRFALVQTGEGIPVSRRVGLASPWMFLPSLPGRSVKVLVDEFNALDHWMTGLCCSCHFPRLAAS